MTAIFQHVLKMASRALKAYSACAIRIGRQIAIETQMSPRFAEERQFAYNLSPNNRRLAQHTNRFQPPE
jgi:hypothetical protein